MRQKALSIITALALCLSLLPGTALAADAGVTIGDTGLEDGKTYVADESGGVEELTEGDELPDNYLEYDGTTLTVHGTVEVTDAICVNSDLTITDDGDGGSSLKTSGAVVLSSATLTLDGGVDFTVGTSLSGTETGESTLTTATGYSGDITIGDITVQGGSNGVVLDVKSSKSITICGDVDCPGLLTLKSSGVIIVKVGTLTCNTATIKGSRVTIATENALAIEGAAEISAEGAVAIGSNNDVPVSGATSLTVKNASNVDITGRSSGDKALFSSPVTFKDCHAVEIVNFGDGKILKEGVTITSDCYVKIAKSEDYSRLFYLVITPDGKTLAYGGDTVDVSIYENTPATAYQAGSGWVLYEPSEGGNAPATLTLDNASCNSILVAGDISVKATGENFVGEIGVGGSVTVDESDGTLNTLVNEFAADDESVTLELTVYGNAELQFVILGQTDGGTTSLTILPGATLTIPDDIYIEILDTEYLHNQGSIVNNGIVTLTGAAAQNATAQTVKDLHFTGSGKVVVEEVDENGDTVTVIYSNDGVKQLTPAEELDFSSLTTSQENTAMGYKWEPQLNDKSEIIGGTLTLQEGFNATTVTLPDAAVTIVTEGASSIGTLTAGDTPEKTQLTFSGTGLLTVDQHIGIDGGDNNRITVAQGAKVVANNGISVGASGGVNGTVTVDGSLTVNGGDGIAIYTGKVAVGTTGVLVVSGAEGVALNGMTGINGGRDFSNLFTVTGDGCFTSNCSTYNVRVQSVSDSFPEGTTAAGAIPLDDEYLPDDCEPKLNEGAIDLVRKSTGEVYTGPITIHKNHIWGGWQYDDDNHWQECQYGSCKQTQGLDSHAYSGDWDADCNVCGYTRTVSHIHEWGEWKYDGDGHWQECLCGATSTKASHVYDNDQDMNCNVCGYERGSGHIHVWAEAWTTSGTHHWHECTIPGCPVTENSQKAGCGEHVYDGDGDLECNICEYRRSAPSDNPSDNPPDNPADNPSDSSSSRPARRPSGGGSDASTYRITVELADHGKAEADRTYATAGSTVTLTATPDSGYALNTLTAADSRGNEIKLAAQGGGEYTFTMPSSDVTVKAAFAPLPAEACDGGADCPSRSFTDLETVGAWYHEAVDYILRNGMMDGYSPTRFGADDNLSRAQLAQILYNRAGKPAVAGSSAFSDVPLGQWYTPAITWAAAGGIVGGYGNGLFGPDDNITREQLAVMLWRYAGSPAAAGDELRFTDTDEASGYALEALRWAVGNGIMSGYGNGLLNPTGLTTRAQAAQVLKNLAE